MASSAFERLQVQISLLDMVTGPLGKLSRNLQKQTSKIQGAVLAGIGAGLGFQATLAPALELDDALAGIAGDATAVRRAALGLNERFGQGLGEAVTLLRQVHELTGQTGADMETLAENTLLLSRRSAAVDQATLLNGQVLLMRRYGLSAGEAGDAVARLIEQESFGFRAGEEGLKRRALLIDKLQAGFDPRRLEGTAGALGRLTRGLHELPIESLHRFTGAFNNMRAVVGDVILRVLQPLLDWGTAWLMRLRRIEERFPAFALVVGGLLTLAIGFTAITAAMLFVLGALGMAITLLTFKVGGLSVAMAIGRTALFGWRAAVAILTFWHWQQNAALAVLWLRIQLLTVQEKLAAAATLARAGAQRLATAAHMAWLGVLGLVTAAQWAWNAALLASPVTWVVAGILLLVGAVVLAIVHWDRIRAAVAGFAAGVPDWVLGIVSAFAPFIGLPLLVIKHWERIKAFFSGLLDWLTRTIGPALQALLVPLRWLGALGVLGAGAALGSTSPAGAETLGLGRTTPADVVPGSGRAIQQVAGGTAEDRRTTNHIYVRTEKVDSAWLQRELAFQGAQ